MLDRPRLAALPRDVLTGLQRGVEKESLRVQPDGRLATTPHPPPLGSALTHPLITTDFSESQVELITGVHATGEACVRDLTEIHQAVYRAIGDELLWCGSMPCMLPDDDLIPLGRYGTSNLGRAKYVYRNGLAHRYGRRMQTISGIHYNFSLPGHLSNDAYFALIRNFRRHSWLLLYLFGASPAVCACFVEGRQHELERLSSDTFYLPYATSLRMGRLGYQSDAQAALAVSYNSLESYGASLQGALTDPYPPYEAIGVRNGDDYRQLGVSLLQIENEFYGTIRPKRRIRQGERPLHALRERGVEYVEVRLMDLDPFRPVGIVPETMHMLDVYLLYCLLSDSPPDTPQEIAALGRNQQRVAAAAAALGDPSTTPSARVLRAMAQDHSNSYSRFVLAQSRGHRDAICALPFSADLAEHFDRLAQESRSRQREIEEADTMPFEIYRQQYLDPKRLGVLRNHGE
jgi:glutamate--cysteine ligase